MQRARERMYTEAPHECHQIGCMRQGFIYQEGRLVTMPVPVDHVHCRCGLAIDRTSAECDLCARQQRGEHLMDVEFRRTIIDLQRRATT